MESLSGVRMTLRPMARLGAADAGAGQLAGGRVAGLTGPAGRARRRHRRARMGMERLHSTTMYVVAVLGTLTAMRRPSRFPSVYTKFGMHRIERGGS